MAAWTVFVVLAAAEGVFARIEPGAYAGLVIFTGAFCALAAHVDPEAVAALGALVRPLRAALVLDGIGVAIALGLQRTDSGWSAIAGALALLVLLPLALVLHAEAARRPRVRTAPGASPGAKRAAT